MNKLKFKDRIQLTYIKSLDICYVYFNGKIMNSTQKLFSLYRNKYDFYFDNITDMFTIKRYTIDNATDEFMNALANKEIL